ncbi:hypothetical protein FACS1894113_5340 [Alphaproteobacteria bacterium]|nr:hypothetical protein FACS1894113_5340 [Alphaproteobacteria bacterium]
MFDQKVGAQKTYDEAHAQMNETKAQLDGAVFQHSKAIIKAPFAGTVGIMKVTVGSIVQQHTDLVNLVDNSVVEVEFMVPVKFIEDIAVGQTVDITVDAFQGKVFNGSVKAIDAGVDVRNHSILVRAVIPNKEGLLKHGMFANVRLITGEKNDVILVSEESVEREGQIEVVWVINDHGKAFRRRVLTGSRDERGVEIIAGLKPGELVVMTGQMKLGEGVSVKILNKKDLGIAEDDEENLKAKKEKGEAEAKDEMDVDGDKNEEALK